MPRRSIGGRIYPVDLKPKSGITNWGGWPDDVEATIRYWNKSCGLSFWNVGVFKCHDCERFCEPDTVGTFRDKITLCDDCLIQRARDGYKPEPRASIYVKADA